MTKILGLILVLLILGMQFRIWFGDNSAQQLEALKSQIAKQELQNQLLAKENKKLREEIRALRNDPDALEERARRQLGLIKPGETFYRIVPRQ